MGINPTRRGGELAGDIRHTDCQVLVTDTAQLPLVDGLDTASSVGRVFVIDDRPGDGQPAAPGTPAGPTTPALAHPGPDALYLLLFTSGSTGAPKAVRVSQGRLAHAGQAMAAGSGFGPGDVLYGAMPMFHGNALNTCVVPAIAAGACLVLRRRFSASGFLPDVRHYGVTYFNYVGRALAYILATPARPDDADNTLRFGFGTDASPSDISAFKKRFGCPIVEGYGSSEGAISMSRVPGTPRQAIGMPPPGTEVAIVDPATGRSARPPASTPAGRLLNASEAIGEIVSRNGAARFEGYYANEEAEAERTRGGWFWSGDLGYRDEAGFFYFAGRPADWLRVDGENFAAAPVERILARFDGVVTAAVYPVPDPRTGDQVMATLELAPGRSFDPAAFAAFLAVQEDLGTKWAPRFVAIADHIPLTGTNKVDKRPLRSAAWDHHRSGLVAPVRRARRRRPPPVVPVAHPDRREGLGRRVGGPRARRAPRDLIDGRRRHPPGRHRCHEGPDGTPAGSAPRRTPATWPPPSARRSPSSTSSTTDPTSCDGRPAGGPGVRRVRLCLVARISLSATNS